MSGWTYQPGDWAVYEFNCPTDGCSQGRSQADHGRRDPNTMHVYCLAHDVRMELVRKVPLTPVLNPRAHASV